MDNIINLTPHDIVLQKQDGERVVIKASGTVARCAPGNAVEVDFGLPVMVAVTAPMDRVVDLPPSVGNTWYIVSSIVLWHDDCRDRDDLVAPGTGPKDGAIRENGQVVAVTRLVKRSAF